jgi:hypothetical protein
VDPARSEEHSVFAKGVPHLGECLVGDWRRQIDPTDLGADRARKRLYLYVIVGHGVLQLVVEQGRD